MRRRNQASVVYRRESLSFYLEAAQQTTHLLACWAQGVHTLGEARLACFSGGPGRISSDGVDRFGWRTLIEYDDFPLGLNEDVVRAISAKKSEPDWLLDFRLRAYRRWLTMKEPNWSDNRCARGAVPRPFTRTF